MLNDFTYGVPLRRKSPELSENHSVSAVKKQKKKKRKIAGDDLLKSPRKH